MVPIWNPQTVFGNAGWATHSPELEGTATFQSHCLFPSIIHFPDGKLSVAVQNSINGFTDQILTFL
jgi:hypothetical protein